MLVRFRWPYFRRLELDVSRSSGSVFAPVHAQPRFSCLILVVQKPRLHFEPQHGGFGANPRSGRERSYAESIRFERRTRPSLLDATQRFVLSGSYGLPQWHDAPKAAGFFVNGWQLNTIVSLASGTPFTVYDSANVSLQGQAPEISGFYSSRPSSLLRRHSYEIGDKAEMITGPYAVDRLVKDALARQNI